MRIEKIREKDFEEVSAMIKKDFPYVDLSFQKIWQRHSKQGVFIFVALQEEKLAGFIDLNLFESEGFVNALSVKQEFRKKGVGKKLAEFAVKFLKENGAHTIRLLVKKENTVAKNIYKKAGFEFAGMHPKKIGGFEVEIMELKSGKPDESFSDNSVN